MTEHGPRLFLLSDNNNGMTAVPDATPIDDLGLLRGDVVPVDPVEFRQNLGKVPRDLVTGGSAGLLLISERVRSILVEGAFSGWATYPVLLRDHRGDVIHGYHGLVVTGRSKVALHPPFMALLARDGASATAWTLRGEADIYLDGGSSAIVVKRAVADALRARKVTNLHLMPVS